MSLTTRAEIEQAADISPRWPPHQRRYVADLATRDALTVIGNLRDIEPAAVFGDLALRAARDHDRFLALVVALAAMVPTDRSPSDLLAWTQGLEEDPRGS